MPNPQELLHEEARYHKKLLFLATQTRDYNAMRVELEKFIAFQQAADDLRKVRT